VFVWIEKLSHIGVDKHTGSVYISGLSGSWKSKHKVSFDKTSVCKLKKCLIGFGLGSKRKYNFYNLKMLNEFLSLSESA